MQAGQDMWGGDILGSTHIHSAETGTNEIVQALAVATDLMLNP